MGVVVRQEADLTPRELAELRAQIVEDTRRVSDIRSAIQAKEQKRIQALKLLPTIANPATIIEIIKELRDLKDAVNALIEYHQTQYGN